MLIKSEPTCWPSRCLSGRPSPFGSVVTGSIRLGERLPTVLSANFRPPLKVRGGRGSYANLMLQSMSEALSTRNPSSPPLILRRGNWFGFHRYESAYLCRVTTAFGRVFPTSEIFVHPTRDFAEVPIRLASKTWTLFPSDLDVSARVPEDPTLPHMRDLVSCKFSSYEGFLAYR